MTLIMRWASGITRLCLWIGFWLLMLAAVLLLAARLLAPRVGSLQPELTDYLQAQLENHVSMTGLHAGWQGARPYLLIDDLSIGAADAQLYLGKVRLYLRPMALLRPRQNALQMEVINARLALHKTTEGWSLSGLSAAQGRSEITARERRQTLEQVLERGDLRLLDAHVSISNETVSAASSSVLIEYADLSRLSAADWRPELQQMAQRPSALPNSPQPQWTAINPDRGGFGMQLRLRPQVPQDSAAMSTSRRLAEAITVAMQLRFSSAGMAVEGFFDLPQQPVSDWLEQWLGPGADRGAADSESTSASRQVQLGSRMWFGWREQDYVQLRGQIDVRGDLNALSADTVGDHAGSGLNTDIEWLWQAAEKDQPAFWRLLLDPVAAVYEVTDSAAIMAGSHSNGGWSASVENLQTAHIAGMLAALDAMLSNPALSQLRQQLHGWVNLQQNNTRIDIAHLQVDREQRILAADLSIEQLLLKQSAMTSQQAVADSIDDIVDCGPFDLHLQMRDQLGWFQLGAETAVCSLPEVVRSPLLLDQVSVNGQVEQLEDGFRIADAIAELRTPDFSLQAQLHLRQDSHGRSGDLQAYMPAMLAARLKDYLPPDTGNSGTVRWIEGAMQGGWLRDLRVAWPIGRSGTIAAERPWDDLQLTLELDDVLMDYARNWPPAQSMQASVRLADNQLLANAPSARMLDTELSRVTARIDELFTDASLHLHANVEGDGEQMLDLLASMPITGSEFSDRDYRLRGPVRAQADIGIDLKGKTALLYARGAAGLNGVMAVTEQITIDDIQGELGFDDEGPTDSTLRARWGDHSARLDWKRTDLGPEIRLQGRFPSQQVAHAAVDLPGLIPHYLAGSSLWKLRLLLGRKQAMVMAYSDLLGTEIRLPAPLNKLAAVYRPIGLTLPLGSGQHSIGILHGPDVAEFDKRSAASGLLSMQLLQLAGGGIAAAAIHLDGVAADWHVPLRLNTAPDAGPLEAGQLRFSGHADAFAVLDWADLLLDYRRDAAISAPAKAAASSAGVGYSIDSNLRTDQLLLGQRNLGPVALRIDPRVRASTETALQPLRSAPGAAQDGSDMRGLALILQGDNIAGSAEMVITATGALVNVDMLKLYLPPPGPALETDTTQAAITAAPRQKSSQSASTLTVNLIADDVRYEQLDLGMVRLELVPTTDGLSLQRLEASSDTMDVNASGGWQSEQGVVQSQLELRLDSNDMGTVLRGLGYDDLVRNAQTTMLLNVNWPGDITQFRLESLQGFLDVQTGRGVIPKASPGAGRALGLLSLQALPQRLFLDFSDVFAEGMEFETASGRFVFDRGVATAEDVVIKAAAATIRMTGTTDLVARTYDQRLQVEPASSLALPLIGVIAGGPIGAGAGFALQSLFSGPIGEISKLEYQITGPWQDPTLTAFSPEPTVKVK